MYLIDDEVQRIERINRNGSCRLGYITPRGRRFFTDDISERHVTAVVSAVKVEKAETDEEKEQAFDLRLKALTLYTVELLHEERKMSLRDTTAAIKRIMK